jgi:hypothetical protein
MDPPAGQSQQPAVDPEAKASKKAWQTAIVSELFPNSLDQVVLF